MRLYVTIILLVLVHQILAGIRPTNASVRGLFVTPITNSDKKTSSASNIRINSSSSSDVSSAIRRCNSIRVHFARYSSKAWRNKIDDDKRMVPTGPNPLHNR